jgi:hypothetical protein
MQNWQIKYKLDSMRMRLTLFILLLFPAVVAAEVSDKAASITLLAGQGVFIATAAFFAARYRWWFSFAGLAIGLILLANTLDLVSDRFVGQALLHEQGSKYIVAAFVSGAAVLVAAITGGIVGWRRRRVAQQDLATDAPQTVCR